MTPHFPGDCFRCGEYGHAMDTCPWLAKAPTRKEHEARIARYVERWERCEITAHQKQKFISSENKLWHGGKCPPSLTL